MVAVGHPGQCRHRLALRPSGDEDDAFGREVLERLYPDDQPCRNRQVAEVTGDAHVADHRATDERDLALVRLGRVEHLLDTVHVRREAGDDDAPLGLTEDVVEHRPDLALGRDEAGNLGVGGVAHQQVDALRAEPRPSAEVGDASVERQLVHLEVARVQHDAGGGADRDAERVGDGVVDGEELAAERPQLLGATLADLEGVRRDPVLLQLALDQRQCEAGPDERHVGLLAQQIRDTADVVLVTVRQHDRFDVVPAVAQVGEVREDQVDARLVGLGEQDTAVDDQQPAGVLEDGHVAADLAETAEGDDPERAVGKRRRGVEIWVRVAHSATPASARSARSSWSSASVASANGGRVVRVAITPRSSRAAFAMMAPPALVMIPRTAGSTAALMRRASSRSPASTARIMAAYSAAHTCATTLTTPTAPIASSGRFSASSPE